MNIVNWEDMDAAELVAWIADKEIKSITIPCTVQSVDKQACTIVAIPFDEGFEFDDVPLRAANDGANTGIVIFPKVGSQVLISRILKFTEFYVSAFTDIDEILITIQDADGNTIFSQHITPDGKLAFNGGNNGGLVIIQNLIAQLTTMQNEYAAIKTLLTTWVPVAGDGGAALKAAAALALDELPAPDFTKMEDTAITH